MSRYLRRDLGYPFYWDDYLGPRPTPRRVVPVQAQPAPRRQPTPEPLTDPDPTVERYRALHEERETLREDKAALREQLDAARAETDSLREQAETLRADIATKDVEIEELSKLVKQHRLRAVEAQNEVEQAKDRIQRQSAKELEQKRRAFAADLLEVLDDLDRALAVAHNGDADAALVEGVELVRKRFLAKLEAHDIQHQPAQGKPFDPERHQAVSTAPVDDPELDRVVVAVLRAGYRVGDETLRPADVVVGKYTCAE